MFATLWAIFRNIFYFSGCFLVVVWFELVGWGGVRTIIFFARGGSGEKRMKWCRCDANEEDDFFAINNWFSG